MRLAHLLLAATVAVAMVPSSRAAEPVSSSSAATPGSEAGAKRLTDDLAAYLSRASFDKGIVKVTPQAGGYRIAIDGTTLAKMAGDAGGKVEIGSWGILVSPRPDGTWNVLAEDPIRVAVDMTEGPLRQKLDYQVGPGRFEGVFSPELGSFLSGSGGYDGGRAITSDLQAAVTASFGKAVYDVTGRRSGADAVDFESRQSITDVREDIQLLQGDAPAGGFPVSVTAASLQVDASATAMKSRAVMDLWAFAIAHLESGKAAADQDKLKTLLGKALPLWDSIEGSYSFKDLKAVLPQGSFSIATLSQTLGGDGVETSGSYRYALQLAGIDVDAPMTPPWVRPLMPRDVTLKMTLADVDLATPARLLIEDIDFARAEPVSAGATEAITKSFMRKLPRLVIEPSMVKSADVTLSVEGTVQFTPTIPVVEMTIDAEGLDKSIAALKAAAAGDPSVNEVIGSIQVAKGFGQTLPGDRTQWMIRTSADGSVSVNGVTLKGPDAPAGGDGDLPGKPAPTDDNAVPNP